MIGRLRRSSASLPTFHADGEEMVPELLDVLPADAALEADKIQRGHRLRGQGHGGYLIVGRKGLGTQALVLPHLLVLSFQELTIL